MTPRPPTPAAAAEPTDTVAHAAPADTGVPLAAPSAPGELGRLGRFRVLGVLGRGGMGAVYHARDDRLGRAVALKVLLPDLSADPHSKARFFREAQAQAKVEHEHVIPIHDMGEADGVAYLVMPLLKGQTLAAALKLNRNPPVAEVVRIGKEIAEGLSAAHDQRLIHRDVKPGNIWLEGAKRRVKILDFGLARAATDADDRTLADAGQTSPSLTARGAVLGTPAYMSPEQARGLPLDARSDVFSLGVVLFEMVTGARPFAGATRFEVMAAVAEHHPPAAHEVNPDVPVPLSELIWRMLAKDPGERPQSCAAVAAELDAVERGLAPVPVVVALPSGPNPWAELDSTEAVTTNAAEPAAPRPPYAPPRVAWRVWAAVAAAVLLAGAAVGGVVWHFNRKPQPQPDQAKVEETPKPAVETKPKPPDAQRDLAEWVLKSKGVLYLEDDAKQYTDAAALPRWAFRVQKVHMSGAACPQLTDKDLERFRGIDSLTLFEFLGKDVTDAGLDDLSRQPFAPKLVHLNMLVPQVTDAGVAHLARFPALIHLWLYGASRVTDGAALAPLTKLTQLGLDGSAVTAAGLSRLNAPKLATLSLSGCKYVDAAAVAAVVAKFPELNHLDVYATVVGDAGAAQLKGLKKLSRLNAVAVGLTDAGAAAVAECDTLTDLKVGHNPLTDDGVVKLAGLSRLTNLSLHACAKVGDRGPEALAGLQFLRAVNLTGTATTLPAVRKLRAALPQCVVSTDLDQKADRKAAEWVLTNGGSLTASGVWVRKSDELPPAFELTAVRLVNPPRPLTVADLEVLRDCDRLRSLTLVTVPKIDAAALKTLGEFGFAPHLETLVLDGSAVTDDGLAALAKFPKLRVIQMPNGNLTGTGLGVCQKLPLLTELRFDSNPVTDAGVKHLRGLKLVTLTLSQSKVTDACLDDLATLTELVHLHLPGTAVTDAGLEKLIRMKKLRHLQVQCPKVTKAGVDKLFESLPDCQIVWNGGGTPGDVPRIDRARPALEQVLKLGGQVRVEIDGKLSEVKSLDGVSPKARLASLDFAAPNVKVPGVEKATREAVMAAVVAALKDLPPAVWSERGARLAFLYGIGTAAEAEALTALPGLRPLTNLGLLSEDAAHFAPHLHKFPRLQKADFNHCRVTATTARQLAALPGLRELRFWHCGLGAAELKELAAAPLERLELAAVPMTDATLAALAGMTKLKELYLDPKDATREQLEKLQAALPECEISVGGQPLPPKK